MLRNDNIDLNVGIDIETEEINDYQFIDNSSVKKITIPNNIKRIGARAFLGCRNLSKVNFNDNITEIGPSAFSKCDNLNEIKLPKSIKKIGYRAFADCKNLKRITIPEGVEEIEWAAFAGCVNLTEITLPNSIKSIGKEMFLGCTNLKKVTLPSNLNTLPDSFFKGCENLDIELSTNIKKLGKSVFSGCFKFSHFPENVESFGENCFENCKNLFNIKLNNNVTVLSASLFENCINISEITLGNNITEISESCFKGCKKLNQINLPISLKNIGSYAFSNCTSLEYIKIPSSIKYIPKHCFNNCTNLKQVKLHNDINYIDDYGFYNCIKLTEFEFPENIKSLGIRALSCCNNIKEIHIPENLIDIELGAFSLMKSLEKITVDEDNPKYISNDDNTVLIDRKNEIIIQYAINSPNKIFEMGYFEESFGKNENDEEITSPQLIYSIADYAFAGAKNLETIRVPSEIEMIGTKTFLNCDKLKNLIVYFTPYGKTFSLNIFNSILEKESIPFEYIKFESGIKVISSNTSKLFKNAKSIILPDTIEELGSYIFSESDKLNELYIPESIRTILPDSLSNNTKIIFEEFGDIESKDLVTLQTKSSNDYYDIEYPKNNIKILCLKNGIYLVKYDDFDTIRISREEISKLSTFSYILEDEPATLFEYLWNLLFYSTTFDENIYSIYDSPEIIKIFEDLKNISPYLENIANENKKESIEKILHADNLKNEIMFNGLFIKFLKKEDIKIIVQNMTESLKKFFKYSKIFDPNKIDDNYDLINTICNNIPKLVNYCKILDKYQVYDRFLYNPKFFINIPQNMQELIIKNYNANLNRFLIESKALDIDDHKDLNLFDLIKFGYVLGVFSENKQLSQKATTFIIEKVFSENYPNGKVNYSRIVGNKIHTIFSDLHPRKELDMEFILFFIENLNELCFIETNTSGFIARVYNAFQDISKNFTSNKGSGRHLRVTIDRCKNYFMMNTFNEVDEEFTNLASLLAQFYDDKRILATGIRIYKESLNAPRNIFTKITYDESGNPIYDNDPANDLSETNKYGFSYEWLPKQDYNNLVLGKYCGCCAHINGAGAGIMRASMILDNCQNLVIKDQCGHIVAKITIWVNKEEGYAVFNTVETTLDTTYPNIEKEIYKAFMRGTKSFLETYNKNNPNNPIKNISVGTYRNSIVETLKENNHKIIEPYSSIDYSSYLYYIGDNVVGMHSGDSSKGQILVITKEA